ncbi:hypothetical protein KKJ22_07330 [Xenorhabdus bovienii]|uniref:hypothetical protein n=1 Tax=Xenorhabdus bovienii TaxID=40576 RepID=UPI00237D07F5|nr:hypothetical protein [Xenorhabdus bovienii]MDE1476420.1 hypothetical protein [Xenorhabdus bovienii]MDE1482702.1 hypothetical protein [Xenorhabdus bovienii]MDE9441138.1 hypothetical protein [Xenorhabdus bovienii]MDE9456359.1 hypothetical protein [Xenorhabdus bovienii]MDE9484592.1 hypothetical protein [Xenorhabdus bovienii]
MEKITALIGNGQTHHKFSQSDISIIREAVISGNWTAINKGICTLTDLGLRHNGQGLVWLNSGVSVHDADSDIGLAGKDKQSFEYHSEMCSVNALNNGSYYGFVQLKDIDSYALNIITSISSEYNTRKNGASLATFALLIDQNQRKKAVHNWILYRNPNQPDKYTILNKHHELAQCYQAKGWMREPLVYIARVIKDNAEFSRLMKRLGYIKVRTRKITGSLQDFWVYRHKEKITPLRTKERIKNNKIAPFVQYAKRPVRAFERIAVDGQWLYVYADHIRFLTKKRHRVEGVRVQGYMAKGIELREVK